MQVSRFLNLSSVWTLGWVELWIRDCLLQKWMRNSRSPCYLSAVLYLCGSSCPVLLLSHSVICNGIIQMHHIPNVTNVWHWCFFSQDISVDNASHIPRTCHHCSPHKNPVFDNSLYSYFIFLRKDTLPHLALSLESSAVLLASRSRH